MRSESDVVLKSYKHILKKKNDFSLSLMKMAFNQHLRTTLNVLVLMEKEYGNKRNKTLKKYIVFLSEEVEKCKGLVVK